MVVEADTSGAGHYHSQMKRTEDRFVTYWTKKRYVNSLANRWVGKPRDVTVSSTRQRKFRGLLLARHPIDRLFSAFRDKILRKRCSLKINFMFAHLNKAKQKCSWLVCICVWRTRS